MKSIHRKDIEVENLHSCIYYIPSIGGTRNEDIREMVLHYVDLDCGRPRKGAFYDDNTVKDFKSRTMCLIRSFPLTPSLIIETRNGFHLYWRLIGPVHEHLPWREIQGRLATYFGGDYAVCSPHQPMRLPFTMWRKKVNGIEPFMVRVVESNDARYRSEDLEVILQDVKIPSDPKILGKVYGAAYRKQLGRSHCTNTVEKLDRPPYLLDADNGHLEAIAIANTEYLQSVLDAEPKTFSNYQECFDYLTKEVNLAKFLGIPGNPSSCCCIVHDDADPSAGITRLESGEFFYNCFACGVRGNIRSLVQFLQGVSHYRALEFLKQVYRISIQESTWQEERKHELVEVKRFITQDLQAYPYLYRNVRNDLQLLHKMIDIAGGHLYGEEYSDSEGTPIFWTSIRYLAHRMGLMSHKTIGTKVVSLCLHGLLRRIPLDQIPKFMLLKSLKYVERQGTRVVKRMVSYFSIPPFAIEDLIVADDKARMIQEAGLVREGYSYDGICRTFGQEVADSIYVDREHRGVSKASDHRVGLMHEIAADLISRRGWATMSEIRELMEAAYKRTLSHLTLRRALPEMLQTYGWKVVWWTEELRTRFSITEKVAGKVIIDPGALDGMVPG